MDTPGNLVVLENPEDVAYAAADRFVDLAAERVTARGRFSVALAGGSTPKLAYELLASQALFSHLPIPPQNIHRMIGEGDPATSARLYEDELQSFFEGASWPRLDLVFLGMGDDGHTASLFPGTIALKEERAWVAANWVEKFKTFRITLTAPAINHAAHVVFIVTGESKARRLADVVRGPRDPERLPSQFIRL